VWHFAPISRSCAGPFHRWPPQAFAVAPKKTVASRAFFAEDCSMSTPLQNGPFVAALMLFAVSGQASADKAADYLQHLPDGSLIVARAAKLDAMDEQLFPLAERFGLNYPPLGQLVTALDGVESDGDVVVGLMWRDDGYSPFALVPVFDFSTFVRAADGDGDSRSTLITLAGEDLVATQRGRWALLTNLSGSEEPKPLGNVAPGVVERLKQLVRADDYSALVLPAGLDRIPATAVGRVSSRQRAQYRRRVHNGPFTLGDPTFWLNALEVYRESLTHFSKECDAIAVGATFGNERAVTLRIAVLSREASYQTTEPGQPANLRGPAKLPAIAGQPTIFTAAGAWKSRWSELLLDLYLYSFAGGSDAVGIHQFSKSALQKYVESTRAASELVNHVAAVVVAPAGDLPIMSHTGIVLDTSNADAYLEAVDKLVDAWNQVVKKSKGEADYVYEKEATGVVALAPNAKGQRYSIDLTTAFRMENVPDVRTLFTKMYGRNGKSVMDVVAIDDHRVLISDLPDELRNQLQQELSATRADTLNSTAETEAAVDWRMLVQPAVLQDWSNKSKLITHGGDIVGWKPMQLASQTPVEVSVKLSPEVLEASATVAGELVEAIGELVNPE